MPSNDTHSSSSIFWISLRMPTPFSRTFWIRRHLPPLESRQLSLVYVSACAGAILRLWALILPAGASSAEICQITNWIVNIGTVLFFVPYLMRAVRLHVIFKENSGDSLESFRASRSRTWARRILSAQEFDPETDLMRHKSNTGIHLSEYDVLSSGDEAVFKPSPPSSPAWSRPAMKSTPIFPSRKAACGSCIWCIRSCFPLFTNGGKLEDEKGNKTGECNNRSKWIASWLAVAVALPVIWSIIEVISGTSRLSPSFFKCRNSGSLSWVPSFAFQVLQNRSSSFHTRLDHAPFCLQAIESIIFIISAALVWYAHLFLSFEFAWFSGMQECLEWVQHSRRIDHGRCNRFMLCHARCPKRKVWVECWSRSRVVQIHASVEDFPIFRRVCGKCLQTNPTFLFKIGNLLPFQLFCCADLASI